MQADREGMARLGLDPESVVGARVAECGFDVWDRLDGLHPSVAQPPSHYQEHLQGLGYDGPNPWEQWANSAEGDDGEVLSGWLMQHADRPARIEEPDSETPYATTRAIEFIEQAGAAPWCLHLSYIKPHWPYIVPAPYHDPVRPGRRPARGAERGRARERAPGARRVPRAPLLEGVLPRRGPRAGDPRLHGAHHPDRRPDRPARRVPRGERARGRDDDRLHLGPRGLSRRPLAGREGALPRALGPDPPHRRRSVGSGRRDPRHRVAGARRGDRPRADVRRGPRAEGRAERCSKGIPCGRSSTEPRRSSATTSSASTTTRSGRRGRSSTSPSRRLAS